MDLISSVIGDHCCGTYDTCVVGIQSSDLIKRISWKSGEFTISGGSSNQVMLCRFVRCLRVIRIVRLMRALHFVAGLRMLIVSIEDSMMSLGWVLFCMMLQIFTFAVIITQYVTAHKMAVGVEAMQEQQDLLQYWGSLDRSILSIYQVLSDGIHCSAILRPLTEYCSPWWALVFASYAAFTVIAAMNVVTGVFVDSALNAATDERKGILLQQMCHMFLFMDADGSGAISEDEFMEQIQNPLMMSYLKALDLIPQDARILFTILDVDDSGEVDAEELISGCLRLHGNAKAFDLAVLMHEFSRCFRALDFKLQGMEDHLLRTLGKSRDIDAKARVASGHQKMVTPRMTSGRTNSGRDRSARELVLTPSSPTRLAAAK